MARKSSVSQLPKDVRTALEALIAGGKHTLDQIIAEMQRRFPATELPSRSATHRYGQKLERRLMAIRASTEAAKLIQAQAGDDKDARSEALTALVQTELFEAILQLQEADDPEMDAGERVGMLSAAAKNIATLSRSSVNLKIFQAKVEEAARKKLLEEQSKALDAMATKGGVTEETKMAIRAELGIIV